MKISKGRTSAIDNVEEKIEIVKNAIRNIRKGRVSDIRSQTKYKIPSFEIGVICKNHLDCVKKIDKDYDNAVIWKYKG